MRCKTIPPRSLSNDDARLLLVVWKTRWKVLTTASMLFPKREAFPFTLFAGFTYRSTSAFLCLSYARLSPPANIHIQNFVTSHARRVRKRNAPYSRMPRFAMRLILPPSPPVFFGMPLAAKYSATLVTNVRYASLDVFFSKVNDVLVNVSWLPLLQVRGGNSLERNALKMSIFLHFRPWSAENVEMKN